LQGRENLEDEKQVEKDRQRAEIFDALGHPTRIKILKVLRDGSLGFADLKKKTTIESSGHLQHHLNKLNGLIKTDEYGEYCLSDEGKDALLTVQTVENESPTKEVKEKAHRWFKVGVKPVAFLLITLLIVSSAIAVYENNRISELESKSDFFEEIDPNAAQYYDQFSGIPLITFTNGSFTPPISMYQALLIGLENDGLNKTSLRGFTIYCSLTGWETLANRTDKEPYATTSPFNESQVATVLTSPPKDYIDTYSNGIIYSYVWHIDIFKTNRSIDFKPYAVIVIDAAIGQILLNSSFI
jgi:DNA-binding transcriptional ArsR family regulator